MCSDGYEYEASQTVDNVGEEMGTATEDGATYEQVLIVGSTSSL